MLQTLELIHFRSYINQLFSFDSGINIIVGPNASGKTNALEAIHMVFQGGSFRGMDTELIHREYDWLRVVAAVDGNERIIKLQKEPKKKTLTVDDTQYQRIQQRHTLPVVVFEPEHMMIVGGEPSLRRTYIDAILEYVYADHKKTLSDYKRLLQQRNRLLKDPGTKTDQFFVWDVQLSEVGGRIAERRDRFIAEVSSDLSKHYQAIAGNDNVLKMVYYSPLDTSRYSDDMATRLAAGLELDRARGFSSVGPHRDDLYIELNGMDAHRSASRGERRSIVLALKIVELAALERCTGKKPILLLDDVFGELDGRRRHALTEYLDKHQVFLTTTDADVAVEHFMGKCHIIPVGSPSPR